MAFWLFKSEPDCFSFAHLSEAPDRTTGWDGVRNFQARNFLRDDVKVGDGVLYYHSNADPPPRNAANPRARAISVFYTSHGFSGLRRFLADSLHEYCIS